MVSTAPLSGIRVVELGHSVAAPYASLILAEMGAEVIKVENPVTGGDYARGWGPPFSGDMATAFCALNRTKTSIALDLTDSEACARLKDHILADADVVIHNFKHGAMDRLGLGAADLLALKPALIYCNIGAFGAVGPLKDRPGYDPLVQAFGGLMSLQGEAGGAPHRVGVSIVDMSTGMWAAIGILGAVIERMATGRGGLIDTSLLESSVAWLSVPISAYLASGQVPQRCGSGVAHVVPYQAFETSDTHLMVAAGNDDLFRRFVNAVGLPHLASDARYRTNADRVERRAELIGLIETQMLSQSAGFWSDRLDAVGVPNGPVQGIDEMLAHPQVEALSIIQRDPGGSVPTVGLPISFDGKRPSFTHAAPALNNGIGRLD